MSLNGDTSQHCSTRLTKQPNGVRDPALTSTQGGSADRNSSTDQKQNGRSKGRQNWKRTKSFDPVWFTGSIKRKMSTRSPASPVGSFFKGPQHTFTASSGTAGAKCKTNLSQQGA
uniref:(northern house mosquito) hypothetical protein n=1 Tax=Culex pipiens TaxID=7175 RepID=A0A8D8AML4_CULPI